MGRRGGSASGPAGGPRSLPLRTSGAGGRRHENALGEQAAPALPSPSVARTMRDAPTDLDASPPSPHHQPPGEQQHAAPDQRGLERLPPARPVPGTVVAGEAEPRSVAVPWLASAILMASAKRAREATGSRTPSAPAPASARARLAARVDLAAARGVLVGDRALALSLTPRRIRVAGELERAGGLRLCLRLATLGRFGEPSRLGALARAAPDRGVQAGSAPSSSPSRSDSRARWHRPETTA
jgi:hypothetical protein